jgi:hypothetical protein
MAALTNTDKVKRRLGTIDITLTDQAIQEYIDDVTEEILFELNVDSIAATEARFGLASKCCTDYAAMYALVRPSGGVTEGLDYRIDQVTVNKSKQLQARMTGARRFKELGDIALARLKKPPEDLPFSNTQEAVVIADTLEDH